MITAALLEQRSCGTKRAYSARVARAVAERWRCHGERMSPYRCPFCHQWHVGHVPSMKTVSALARVIRGLDPEETPITVTNDTGRV